MTLSMYQASIPVLIHDLKTLSAILKKSAAHAKAKGIDPAVLLNARLYPDMLALSRQVQIAADMAKGGGARLAGIDIPSFADTETTFVELQERLARTVAFLKSIRPQQVDGGEKREINLPMRIGTVTFPGQYYLLSWVLPNVFFHTVTAYNILRHNGVELGKWDFLGKAPGAVLAGRKRATKPRKSATGTRKASSPKR